MAIIALAAIFKPNKPFALKLLIVLILSSFCNELANFILNDRAGYLNIAQFCIDFVCVGLITTVIYFGVFSYVYSGLFLLLQLGTFTAIYIIIHAVYTGPTAREIALAIMQLAFLLLVLVTMTFRVKKLLTDYRFWVLLGLFSYYAIAISAFIYPANWWLNSVALVIATVIILIGFYFGLFTYRPYPLPERFLIPKWLKDRIRYLNVPRNIFSE